MRCPIIIHFNKYSNSFFIWIEKFNFSFFKCFLYPFSTIFFLLFSFPSQIHHFNLDLIKTSVKLNFIFLIAKVKTHFYLLILLIIKNEALKENEKKNSLWLKQERKQFYLFFYFSWVMMQRGKKRTHLF